MLLSYLRKWVRIIETAPRNCLSICTACGASRFSAVISCSKRRLSCVTTYFSWRDRLFAFQMKFNSAEIHQSSHVGVNNESTRRRDETLTDKYHCGAHFSYRKSDRNGIGFFSEWNANGKKPLSVFFFFFPTGFRYYLPLTVAMDHVMATAIMANEGTAIGPIVGDPI